MTSIPVETSPLSLAEVTIFDPSLGATRVLRYCSEQGFTTKPSDTPANAWYNPVLKQPVDVTRNLFTGGNTSGSSIVGLGDLVLLNPDGALDDLLLYGFDGQSLVVRVTTKLNPAYPADFTTVFSGTMSGAEFDDQTVTIKVRDLLASLQLPFQTNKYGGTNVLPNGLDGVATDLAGKVKPVLLGKALNFSPPCVNTSKLIYQISDGEISSVDDVFDRGIPLSVGLQWSAQTSGFGSTAINGVTHGDDIGLWVAVGDTGTLTTATDPTGTWTARTSGFGSTNIRDVARGIGYFVAVGDAGKIYRSATGTSGWTSATTPSFGTSNINAIAFGTDAAGNPQFLAAGADGKRATSPDGDVWTQRAAAPDYLSAIGYREWAGGRQWATVAGTSASVAISNDGGVTWIDVVTLALFEFAPVAVAGNADGWAVATSAGIASSTADSLTWDYRNGTPVPVANALAYVNGAFFGVGALGYVYRSIDRRNWERQTDDATTETLNAIAVQANGQLVAGGTNGALIATPSKGLTYATLADLQDDSLAPAPGTYKYISDAAGSYVRLGSNPSGTITCDATQGASAADRTAAQLFKAILLRAGAISA